MKMKPNNRFGMLNVCAILCVVATVVSGVTVANGQQTGEPRRFLAADYQKKLAAVVEPDNRVSWQIPIQDIHDAQPLDDGAWLIQRNFREVVEVDAGGKVTWEYQAGRTREGAAVEIHAFQRLENGLTMIAESGTSRILLVNREREIVKTVPLQVEKADPHRDTRLVRVTPEGNFLVAHESQKKVSEYDGDGKVVWEYAVGSQVYAAERLPNGNTLIGTGDGHRVVEVDGKGEVVWEIRENDLAGVKLVWVTMVQRLPNGNTLIVNCHAGPEQPQVLEVTPDKQVVWSFRDFERFGNSLPVAVPLK